MWRLAYRQLRLDAVRTLFTWIAIAAVISLILVLEGFLQGLLAQSRAAVKERGAQLVVTQAGVANLLAARSSLPQLARRDVEAVGGVAQAHPLTSLPVIYEQDGRKTPVFILVYDSAGGPVGVPQDRLPTSERDIVIDRSLAEKYALAPGDAFPVSGYRFTVTGITQGDAALFTPFAFINYDGLIEYFMSAEVVADLGTFALLSFLLVELEPGVDRAEVASRIEQGLPYADVFTPEALAQNEQRLGRDLFGPVMGVLIGVAYVIGALVVGMIMYAEVMARRRAMGVLKALGFGPGALSAAITLQGLLVVVAAIPLGMLMAYLIGGFIQWRMPLYLLRVYEPLPVLRTTFACAGFALLGGLLALRVIARLDTRMVFHA